MIKHLNLHMTLISAAIGAAMLVGCSTSESAPTFTQTEVELNSYLRGTWSGANDEVLTFTPMDAPRDITVTTVGQNAVMNRKFKIIGTAEVTPAPDAEPYETVYGYDASKSVISLVRLPSGVDSRYLLRVSYDTFRLRPYGTDDLEANYVTYTKSL